MNPQADFARRMRRCILRMVHRANASHVGGALSMVELLTVLYGPNGRLRVRPQDPAWSGRDRFILSKGHAATGLYAALAGAGFFPAADLRDYARDGSRFMAHATRLVPGVEVSTGSLGHGLPMACGLAYAARLQEQPWRSVALLSDGELDEGSNWEAFLFAGHHRLERLWALIDANGMQSLGRCDAVLDLEPLADKLRAFGWGVVELDGHDLAAVHGALDLDRPALAGRPTAVIARTIKGKGVSFMEDQLLWHYRAPDAAQLARALGELGGAAEDGDA